MSLISVIPWNPETINIKVSVQLLTLPGLFCPSQVESYLTAGAELSHPQF